MKKYKSTLKYSFSIFCLLLLLINTGCKEDAPVKSETELQLEKLNATWKASSVTKDGVVQTDYSNFVLTLLGDANAAAYNYSASGRPSNGPWKSGGAWMFGSAVSAEIIRDKGTADELKMTYTVTETQLTLEFTFSGTGYSNSRASSASGQWKFVLIK